MFKISSEISIYYSSKYLNDVLKILRNYIGIFQVEIFNRYISYYKAYVILHFKNFTAF